MGKGQELYKKAKTLIPGGTQLLSKRPEMFLPDQWPAYIVSHFPRLVNTLHKIFQTFFK